MTHAPIPQMNPCASTRCETHLKDRYVLTIVDLYEHRECARPGRWPLKRPSAPGEHDRLKLEKPMPNWSDTAPPGVDQAALGVNETEVGRETLIELITLFLTDGVEQIAIAREAAAAGRAEKVKFVAHRLKPMSYYLGARSLSSLCGEIEAACAEGRQPDLPAELQRLETLFGQVTLELEAYAAGRP